MQGTSKPSRCLDRLAASLEREAGHICVAFLLIGVGFALWRVGMPKTDDILPFALGLLSRSMGTKALNSVAKSKPVKPSEPPYAPHPE
jgi:hypothetical protein